MAFRGQNRGWKLFFWKRSRALAHTQKRTMGNLSHPKFFQTGRPTDRRMVLYCWQLWKFDNKPFASWVWKYFISEVNKISGRTETDQRRKQTSLFTNCWAFPRIDILIHRSIGIILLVDRSLIFMTKVILLTKIY